MKKLFMALAVVSLFIASNAFAAQIKYSFKFTVGSAQFDGNTLSPSAIATLDFYGDTDSVIDDQMLQNQMSLPGDLTIDGVGTYVLTDSWRILAQQWPPSLFIGLAGSSLPLSAIYVRSDVPFETPRLDDAMTLLEPGVASFELVEDTQFNTTGGVYIQTADDGSFISFNSTVVPIPSAIWLLGSGLIGLVGFRKKFWKV